MLNKPNTPNLNLGKVKQTTPGSGNLIPAPGIGQPVSAMGTGNSPYQTQAASNQTYSTTSNANSDDASRGDVMRWWYGNGGTAGGNDSYEDVLNQYLNRNPNSPNSQLDYAAGGKDFSPVTMKNADGSTYQAQMYGNPGAYSNQQNQTQFNDMFRQYNEENSARFASLEKMLQDMINANAYNKAQQAPMQAGGNGGTIEGGKHIFDAKPNDNGVGYTQGENSMNEALFKYLQNRWNGGF